MPTILRHSTSDLSVYSVEGFLKRVPPVNGTAQQVCFDLSNLEFIDLFSTVIVLYTCQHLALQPGWDVQLHLTDGRACNYLSTAGFLNVLPDGVRVSHPFGDANLVWRQALRGDNSALVELTPLANYEAVAEVLHKLRRILKRRLKYGNREANLIVMAYSEICNNILEHSQTNVAGLAAMQVFNGQTGKFLHLVVGDMGVGIKTTLTRNKRFSDITSDVDAIMASTDPSASEYDDVLHGNGLPAILELCAQNGGSIHIRSGSGCMYWRWDQPRPPLPLRGLTYLPGVQIALSIPLHTGP